MNYAIGVSVSSLHRPVPRGGAKGAYAPPPFARDACRRPSTQPLHIQM